MAKITEALNIEEEVSFDQSVSKYITVKTTKKQLNKFLNKWQKILRLTDWNIKIEMSATLNKEVLGQEVNGFNILAEIKPEPYFKRALIRVSSKIFIGKDITEEQIKNFLGIGITHFEEMPDDIIEEHVVHELLHLLVKHPFEDSDEIGTMTEQSINVLAKALVEQDRLIRKLEKKK